MHLRENDDQGATGNGKHRHEYPAQHRKRVEWIAGDGQRGRHKKTQTPQNDRANAPENILDESEVRQYHKLLCRQHVIRNTIRNYWTARRVLPLFFLTIFPPSLENERVSFPLPSGNE